MNSLKKRLSYVEKMIDFIFNSTALSSYIDAELFYHRVPFYSFYIIPWY